MRRRVALLRNSGGQLTSMRTALILLFLLAVAAIPGSVLPQRAVSPENGRRSTCGDHPDLGAALDRLGAVRRVRLALVLRDLPAAVHLAGRLPGAPRCATTCAALRAAPPPAPARLDRLPQPRLGHQPGPPDGGGGRPPTAAQAPLPGRARRRATTELSRREGLPQGDRQPGLPLRRCWRCCSGVARRARWYGWHGNRLLVAGADSGLLQHPVQQYDELRARRPGRRSRPAAVLRRPGRLPGHATSTTGSRSVLQADVTLTVDGPGGRRADALEVNDPLRLDGAERLPARPRVRADPALHRPVRRRPDRGRRRSCPRTRRSPATAWPRSRTPTSTRRPARRQTGSDRLLRASTCRPCRSTRPASVLGVPGRARPGPGAASPTGATSAWTPASRSRSTRSTSARSPPASCARSAPHAAQAGRDVDAARRHHGRSSSAPSSGSPSRSGTTPAQTIVLVGGGRAAGRADGARCPAGAARVWVRVTPGRPTAVA